MSRALYDGPIIDAHHHLWDCGMDRHPWLRPTNSTIQALGNLAPLRRNYLVDDYLRDVAGQHIVASVHIEALWDRARNPAEETQWLDSLEKPGRVGHRYVAYAPLEAPNFQAVAEAHRASERVVGVRYDFRWHLDPRKRFVDSDDLMDQEQLLENLAALSGYSLSFDVLIYPQQSSRLAQLARRFVDVQFIVNHCGSPVDPDQLNFWRHGLRLMSAEPNIAIKVSDIGAYFPRPSEAEVIDITATCIEHFGVARVMFGSDLPVASLNAEASHLFPSFKQAVKHLPENDQRQMFFDNANSIYRLEL
jgi:predicted TIM-barrel fold metal-dependent hydrolase